MTAQAKRDLALLGGLVLLHEVLCRVLSGEAIVSALFAPVGARTFPLLVGLGFVVLRVVLFVGVPGWAAAQSLLWVAARCEDGLSRRYGRAPPSARAPSARASASIPSRPSRG